MTAILSKDSRLQVYEADKPQTGAAAQSPFAIPPTTAGGTPDALYTELLNTANAIMPKNAKYREGFTIAWTLLHGVTTMDLAATKALLLAEKAAISKGKDNYGQGVTDVDRLLNMPDEYKRDIHLVIAKQ